MFTISQRIFQKTLNLSLLVRARNDDVESVLVNSKKVKWYFDSTAIRCPLLRIKAPKSKLFKVEIRWKGDRIKTNPVSSAPIKHTSTDFVRVQKNKALYWKPDEVSTIQGLPHPKHEVSNDKKVFERINLTSYFNDQVSNIFKNRYLLPRPKGPTLQLPTQGIGNWAYPLVMPNISDSGLRQKAGEKDEFVTQRGIPFSTPSQYGAKNILFTSQWDNYPDSAIVYLSGKGSHAYLLMAGSTNPMQSRMVNGEVVIQYKDGSEEKLELKNPENWWPIEQDYYEDGFAFSTDAPKPVRVYFKTGEDTRTFKNYTSLRGFSNRAVDGGAGTVLDMPLNPAKELKSLTLKAVANDVVIGLMSLTLVRLN